jgi:hypothetical protein
MGPAGRGRESGVTSSHRAGTVLILGGAGMVGQQVAREVAREIKPARIVISALTQREVDEAAAALGSDQYVSQSEITGAPGDIFVPQALQGKSREELIGDASLFGQLFDDIFSPDPEAYRRSALYHLIDRYKPETIVDCINTATAISYQDLYTTSRKVKLGLDELESRESLDPGARRALVGSIRELLIAQGLPQITRHILTLYRALRDTDVRVYVKVGTTGTGGMGINIPYTHSEERPSATLLTKSAVGFAHTGLLFLLARTPGALHENGEVGQGTMIKEIKPGAMIGFKRLGETQVCLVGASGRREPASLVTPHTEPVGKTVQPREPFDAYPPFDGGMPLRIVGADTGENGFFSIGEFRAITYPRQMEYVTPEEVARTVVLEILGASTGRDVLAAIDGAITEPSYRAGLLREQACREMDQLEEALRSENPEHLPSIAVGQLGPPRLTKLLAEAFLLREAAQSSRLAVLLPIEPREMQRRVDAYLARSPRVISLIATIGIPILREERGGLTLTRGPRLNIPVPNPDGLPSVVDLERFAFHGWVDLRLRNFEVWRERLHSLSGSIPDIAGSGSAAFERSKYMSQDFVPGDVVGWLLTNEVDDLGMVGRRLF